MGSRRPRLVLMDTYQRGGHRENSMSLGCMRNSICSLWLYIGGNWGIQSLNVILTSDIPVVVNFNSNGKWNACKVSEKGWRWFKEWQSDRRSLMCAKYENIHFARNIYHQKEGLTSHEGKSVLKMWEMIEDCLKWFERINAESMFPLVVVSITEAWEPIHLKWDKHTFHYLDGCKLILPRDVKAYIEYIQ